MTIKTESEKNQKKYYDSIAKEYEFHYNDENALKYRHQVYDDFLKGIKLEGINVLDAMCGGGQSASFFHKKGAIVTGVDISEGQTENFKKRFPNCEIYCDSILNFTINEGNYDFFITDSVHHLHPNVKECMERFYCLLKPGGYLMIWEPSAGSVFDLIRKLWYKTDKKYFQDNEASIDLERLTKDFSSKFSLKKSNYGGNFGYVLLLITMALRKKNKISNKSIVNFILFLERIINKIQNKYISLWFMALYQKK